MVHNVVPFVHQILDQTVKKDDYTIDATCGNGYDTLKLASLSKMVIGLDVQSIAIKNTSTLLKENGYDNFVLYEDSHEFIYKYINQKIKAAVFNLGYLPNSDKQVKTSGKTTVKAIQAITELLDKGGVICITLYTGHEGGLIESKEVEDYAKSLNNRAFKVIKYDFINREKTPYVIVIEKQ